MSEEASIGETPLRESIIISRPPPIPPRPTPGTSRSNLPSPMKSEECPGYLLKRFSLRKWNINYTGDTCVRSFFTSIEEEKDSDDISDGYLLKRFHEVLSGRALNYFRSIRGPDLTYPELKKYFFKTFGAIDYEFKTEQQVRNLKQKSDQSVIHFVHQISQLNDTLRKPVDKSDLLEIIIHNMHPKYFPCLSIHKFTDLDALVDTTSHFESFLPKTTKLISSATNQSQQCPKCNKTGHPYRSCPDFPGMLCFKCRTPGFITRDCPKCDPKNV